MTQAKQKATKFFTHLFLMLMGAVIFGVMGFSIQLYNKRDALVVAWNHPDVVKDLQINTKTVVEKK